jgi:hypothetical protein
MGKRQEGREEESAGRKIGAKSAPDGWISLDMVGKSWTFKV